MSDKGTKRITQRLVAVILTFCVLTSGVVGVVSVSTPVAAASQSTSVSTCTTISQPGVYDITANLTNSSASCLDIESDDVVLNGNGHTITGNGSGVGIAVGNGTAISNVTVRNVTVDTWRTGVRLNNTDESTLDSVTSTNASLLGMQIALGSDRNEIVESTVGGSPSVGFAVTASNETVIRNSSVSDTAISALYTNGSSTTTQAYNLSIGNSTSSSRVDIVGTDVDVQTVSSPPVDPTDVTNISKYVHVSPTGNESTVDITQYYTDADLGAVNESSLTMYRYDGNWSTVNASMSPIHNMDENWMIVEGPNEYGTFALMGTAET
ncbi:right-handed parallel beta-helix repeat-containing protein, partial [Haloferax profundi]|uniref:right-handed parallel beta-helix repeat-containing protein n=1 Tax=Haloferax profundi TaxID=1544718 RepID=UPI000B230AC3